MEFWTSLIVVKKDTRVIDAEFLFINCTYVGNSVWIYEGDIDCLIDEDIDFNVVGEGAVPCLGDLSQKNLVDLCAEVFGVNVYELEFNEGD